MSLNTLKIASDGYLKRTTKAALIIAVSGYLNYSDVTPPVPPVIPPYAHIPSSGENAPAWGIGTYGEIEDSKDKDLKKKKQILIEDSEIIAIVEITLKNFII